MTLSVLFVDDEATSLHALRQATLEKKDEWLMAFVENGDDAMAKLGEQKFDVIISDLHMHGADGAQFLDQAREVQPESMRIVLAGPTDIDLAARSAKSAHRFLAKPCAADELSATIHRAAEIRRKIANPALHASAAAVAPLPSVPKLYQQLTNLLAAPDTDMGDVAQVIKGDMSMASAVLKLANSSYFGLATTIQNIEKAAVMLGIDVIKNMVLAHEVFNAFDTKGVESTFDEMWEESMAISAIASSVASLVSENDYVKDQAMTSAILQNLGKLILMTNHGKQYLNLLASVQGDEVEREKLEKTEYGFHHEELASYVLGLWGLPNLIVEAVYYARSEQLFSTNLPLNCLIIANAIFDQIEDDKPVPDSIRQDMEFFGLDVEITIELGERVLKRSN